MASKDDSNAPKQLKQDPLVEQLAPDPGAHTPTIQLTGWLGKGSKEGRWRLYLNPQLDEYVEFSDKDVLHTQALDPKQSLLGGTMVWLRASADLEYLQVVRRQVQADFLSGGITSGFMAGTASSLPGSRGFQAALAGTRDYRCSINPHIPACQIRTEVCGGGSGNVACGTGPFCGTGAFVCGATAGCSGGHECSVGC